MPYGNFSFEILFVRKQVGFQQSVGRNLTNRMTQTPLAFSAMALAFISSWVWGSFAGPTEESSVGAACLDRVGLGSNRRRPTLGLGCGNSKHRGDSHVIGRKRPSLSSSEERNCGVSSGFRAGVIPSLRSSSHMSFSHTRWSLPWSWQAEAPPVPVGQYLQAGVRRKKVHLEPRRGDYCPKPSWAASFSRWRTGDHTSLHWLSRLLANSITSLCPRRLI